MAHFSRKRAKFVEIFSSRVPDFSNAQAPDGCRIAIVYTSWNNHITAELLNGALKTVTECGMNADSDIDTYCVPGAVELTFAASQLIETSSYDVYHKRLICVLLVEIAESSE